MRYSISFWLFSSALIMALGCQLTNAQRRPSNPESDVNCVPVESVKKDDTTWSQEDRVFICKIRRNRFDIFSYEKHEAIAFFRSSNVEFKEQWALSICFTLYKATSVSHFRCTFSQIEHAQVFYDKVNPDSKLSPQYFTSSGLESCVLLQGRCQNRLTVTNDRLVFHQHFIDSRRTKFTFEPEHGLGAEDLPPLIFLRGEFNMYRLNTEIILAFRDNTVLCYVLHFDDCETAVKFFDYMRDFFDTGSNAENTTIIQDDLD